MCFADQLASFNPVCEDLVLKPDFIQGFLFLELVTLLRKTFWKTQPEIANVVFYGQKTKKIGKNLNLGNRKNNFIQFESRISCPELTCIFQSNSPSSATN